MSDTRTTPPADPRAGSGDSRELDRLRTTYDAAAAGYARLLPDLRHEQPLDRALLAAFAEHVLAAAGEGRGRRVLDAGCGTGRLTGHLVDLGLEPTGVDLSPRMVAVAAARHPGTAFAVADLAALPHADAAFDGVLAWYSLIHTPPRHLPAVAAELARVLRPGGTLLTGFQLGCGPRAIVDAYGSGHSMTGHLHEPEPLAAVLADAGLETVATGRREPVVERHPQGFVLARKAVDAPGDGPAPSG